MNTAPAFVPRMQSEPYGFTVVDELRWRGWGGLVADVWHVECAVDAGGWYLSPDPRLFMVLDIADGGALELSAVDRASTARHEKRLSIAYIPAGVAIRSRAIGLGRLKHLDIHIPEAALTRKFGRSLDLDRVNSLRLQFEDGRIAAIASLLAEECVNEAPLHDRYGEGLIDALLSALFETPREHRKSRPSLSRSQLRQSVDYIEEHCFETIRLHELASRLGLSETYFSHAFKASTGIPPLRWHMNARIGRVKELLSLGTVSLPEIAATAGFADQAHLTRMFKRVVGVTPAEWRRNAGPGA